MIPLTKVEKLIDRLSHLVDVLDKTRSLALHVQGDQSFYTERIAELNILLGRYREAADALAALEVAIAIKYKFCFRQWKQDLKTVNYYLNESQKTRTVL